MTNGIERDLAEDLAICDEVSAQNPGIWFVMHDTDVEREWPPGSCECDSVAYSAGSVKVAEFIAEAHVGWPIAIRRAISAEKALKEAQQTIARQRERLRQIARYQRDTYESALHAWDNCKVIAKAAIEEVSPNG